MSSELPGNVLTAARATFRTYKNLAERAILQVDDLGLVHALDEETNSIAVIMRHVGGNLRSRWTDFLTTDGEKPDRNRGAEFSVPLKTPRSTILEWWERGWQCLFGALDSLTPEDLGRTVTIRGEPLSVIDAIVRSLAHTAYHVGQIVLLAKHLRSREWESLSLPRRR
jgi:hypothetical protein